MQEVLLDDVYDIWYTPFWQTWVGYAILLALLLGGFLLLYWLIKTVYFQRWGFTKERALRRLQALRKKVEHKNIDSKKVYQELTDAMKSYAQSRCEMPHGMTDFEFTSWLVDAGYTKEHRNDIVRIMSDAQAVKYGFARTLKKQVQKDIKVTISFIEVTGKHTE